MDTKKVAEGFILSATFAYLFKRNSLCQQVYRSLLIFSLILVCYDQFS